MIKLCLVTLSLDRSWRCSSKLKEEKRAYAEKWGASLIDVSSWNDEAFDHWHEQNCPREGHFAKLAVVAHYATLCDRLVYMDDTIRIKADAPNLWALPRAVLWAPKDVPQLKRKRHFKQTFRRFCQSLNNATFHCSLPMFNSGLMVLQAGAPRFKRLPHCSTFKDVAFADQGYFNALFPDWNDLLSVTSVLQGSEINTKNVPKTTFVHVTRGAGVRQRMHWLCSDLLADQYVYAWALFNQ